MNLTHLTTLASIYDPSDDCRSCQSCQDSIAVSLFTNRVKAMLYNLANVYDPSDNWQYRKEVISRGSSFKRDESRWVQPWLNWKFSPNIGRWIFYCLDIAQLQIQLQIFPVLPWDRCAILSALLIIDLGLILLRGVWPPLLQILRKG